MRRPTINIPLGRVIIEEDFALILMTTILFKSERSGLKSRKNGSKIFMLKENIYLINQNTVSFLMLTKGFELFQKMWVFQYLVQLSHLLQCDTEHLTLTKFMSTYSLILCCRLEICSLQIPVGKMRPCKSWLSSPRLQLMYL